MAKKISQKKNASSIQVIKTLKVLLQGHYGMGELVDILNSNEKEPIFNNSVISKYINTCRYCGIEIPKINNRYYVAKMPFGLELTLSDTEILKHMQFVVKNDFSKKGLSVFEGFIERLNKFSNKRILNVNKDEYNLLFELFENAVEQKRKVKLIFKNKDITECIPIDITKIGDKIFFNVFNKKLRQIDINRLSGIQFSENTFIEPFNSNQVVVFKLKGGLAKRYEARENETVEQNPDGTITVTNRNENQDCLISRLLRYDDKCEVLQPKSFRESMKEVLNDMLKNYGE